MAAKGATFWATSPWNFIYDHRGPGHAWVASDVTVRRQLGDAWRFCEGVAAPEFVPRPSDAEVFEDMRL